MGQDLAIRSRSLGADAEPSASAGGWLSVDERAIRAAARRFGPPHIALTFLRQGWRELVVRRLKRIQFRRNANAEACAAYCAMSVSEFEDINARQHWANWRTIPRNLAGRLPDRPVTAIDLCCGVGDSTAVLAWWCAPGSRVIGLEYNPAFVERASSRTFAARDGSRAEVSFRAQSVLETFCDAAGAPIPDGSVDLVNASGAIGCHFDCAATERLAAECARVVRHGGLATIDSGSDGTGDGDLARIFGANGFAVVHRARSCFLDRFTQLCFRRGTPDAPPAVSA